VERSDDEVLSFLMDIEGLVHNEGLRIKDQPLPWHASGITRLQISHYPFVTD